MFCIARRPLFYFFFFFNDTATTEIYTLSLHDALPISVAGRSIRHAVRVDHRPLPLASMVQALRQLDRKSTRLNSSHSQISYAVFCLKKKKKESHTRYDKTSTTPPQSTSRYQTASRDNQ